ncbi:GNAT family N-acetyltransferase [Endothiovibrio diazotrophicus]
MSSLSLGPVVKLAPNHDTGRFDCGSPPLDRFLHRFALANQRADGAQTFVVCRGDQQVVGYYSLAVGSVEHATAPSRLTKGLARHPVPVMLLARLAVDRQEQGRGLGRALLKDALLRILQAAEIAGIRAIITHAKDERAHRWYEQFDFEPSPTDPLHLFLLLKDLRGNRH